MCFHVRSDLTHLLRIHRISTVEHHFNQISLQYLYTIAHLFCYEKNFAQNVFKTQNSLTRSNADRVKTLNSKNSSLLLLVFSLKANQIVVSLALNANCDQLELQEVLNKQNCFIRVPFFHTCISYSWIRTTSFT